MQFVSSCTLSCAAVSCFIVSVTLAADSNTVCSKKKNHASNTPRIEVTLASSFELPTLPRSRRATHSAGVAFSGDGKRFLAVTSAQELVVFDRETGALLRRKRLRSGDAISVNSRGTHMIHTLPGGGASVVNLQTWKSVGKDEHSFDCVAMSPAGDRVAVSRGRKLEIRDSRWMRRSDQFIAESPIMSIAWSPNGRNVAYTTKHGCCGVYDVRKKKNCFSIQKKGVLYAAVFHPKGHQLAYGGESKKIWVYDFLKREEILLASGQPFWITCLGYSPDGDLLAAGDESCDIWLFDVVSRQRIFHGKHHSECWLTTVAWAPGGDGLTFGCRRNSHAPFPNSYGPLSSSAAQQTTATTRARANLMRVLDEELKNGSERRRLLLNDLKKDLENHEAGRLFEIPPPSPAGPAEGAPAANAVPPSEPTPAELYRQRWDRRKVQLAGRATVVLMLLKEYETLMSTSARRLDARYSCHQWRVRKVAGSDDG